ncbi:MAG: extracellular solute-binding protein [Treponema sp.]|nr:extracellular solute-binding protein [Treponema sp.]
MALFPALFLISCAFRSSPVAVLWTDRPEFALYAEHFNASQETYKIETRYFESPSQKLTENGEVRPDIVAGSWLKSVSTRSLFRPLDDLFKKNRVARDSFYQRLLDLGNIDGKQYLLPVAFNIPALVFARDRADQASNPFTLTLEEIKALGKSFNVENGGVYSRMGFSPAWDDDFLFVSAALFGASFREDSPLEWDNEALERALSYIESWIGESNTGIQAEDDFTFKYFYDPPSKLVVNGRIRFFYMSSSDLFTLPQERRANLDFRWIAEEETIPLSEDMVYFGIYRHTKAQKAAEAFTQWFFQEDTQRIFLEAARDKRLNETRFGIANGFSALQTVTERVFPQFYPSLLGHIPPGNFLSPPNILPRNWMAMKERVILPYLHDRIRSGSRADIRSLDRRLRDWNRLNRDL